MMNPIVSKTEMTAAVDRVLAAMGLEREGFADRRDSTILDELASDFEFATSPPAAIVLAHAADAARELEGYVRKICCRCDREFWIVVYLAPKRAFDRCGRADCVQASVVAA